MKVQFNTDKTIDSKERHEDFYTARIAEELKRYQSYITRIEVHISDEKSTKVGRKDVKCLLEARLEGKKPIVASSQAEQVELAVSEALDKLKASLETKLGRLGRH